MIYAAFTLDETTGAISGTIDGRPVTEDDMLELARNLVTFGSYENAVKRALKMGWPGYEIPAE
jgi:hypothetical protein